MATLSPPFTPNNTDFAYQLHYHLGFRTRRSAPVFGSTARTSYLNETIEDICSRNDFHILELETDLRWVRMLLSLRPNRSPAEVAKIVKGNSSRHLFESFPEIERELGCRSMWSRAYYVRGIGDVTSEVVQNYVARQREHHETENRNSRQLAAFIHPSPHQYFDLRPWSHCVAEYNCHLVISPVRHVPAIDASIADELLQFVRKIAMEKRFEILSLAVLEDHLHLFTALRPDQSPQDLALAVMNNTWHWIWKRNPGALKLWDAPNFWTQAAFVRTAGVVTTNQVRAHLQSNSVMRRDD